MVSLHPATTADDRVALENLMQLYAYDWSELRPLDVDARGLFAAYPLDAYWHDDWRHPFLLKSDDALVGFALVTARSRLTDTPGVFDMSEFFVMRRYRRRGVGMAAAMAAFERFEGPWEVRERVENTEAITFWRRAVGRFTNEHYTEVLWDAEKWRGPVQSFSSARG